MDISTALWRRPLRIAGLGFAGTTLLAVIIGCTGEGDEAGSAQAREASGITPETVSTNLPLSSGPQAGEAQAEPTPTMGGISQSVDQSRTTALVRAAERVAPAVVSVNVLRQERIRARTIWEEYFLGPSAARRSTGYGSGIIFDANGYILTNDHVIRGAQQIRVTLPDGRDYPAELTGSDGMTDVAVLKVDAEDLPLAPLGTSEGLLIGEWTVAIGNPFAYLLSNPEPTVTAGVVSAAGRHIIGSNEDQGFYLGMIQTDASINPGNSGGPLVNALGEVVGVNTSIFSRSGGSEGLGFAIPIDRALRVAEDLIQYGEVRRAWTGVEVEAVEADEWGRTRGVRIASVAPGSPADQAGLSRGDRLVAANGRPLGTPLDFEAVLLDARVGDGVEVSRAGDRRPLRLVAESLPTARAERVEVLEDLEVVSVTPEIRAEQGLSTETGALITGISSTVAQSLGLARGDVILQINNIRIRTADEAARIIRELRGGRRVLMYFERNNNYYVREFVVRR
jgi:serine protease Do